ncbi:pseudouridine-5'-phosphate glycosidase [Puniceicoccales bacterium CK1056]|uniref:Pseudouridine-5'-phosphate glycosidase n=1 Tax=Oceanipulchritudo coccoides TaxID=2706888 RepID=A0A6B2LYS8_9BACT|nr:pseudouridine-5'-phosphate glycosidase [Oceanipulchritudo coccoides]NDV61206.1 pseudouridine-5'-phosphate glycosidase [Oceanipulchritudo coccoides]
MTSSLHIRPDIKEALREGRAVVALESTVITHGLPYPDNLETAMAMESAVRESGALPATIGIVDGRVTVGLTGEEIELLAKQAPGTVRKCSRRDFAIAIAAKEHAGTTVAGTMLVAYRAGIRVFATGGIGGVHRGHPYDVSADLEELGRTPVAVVCSGAKAILDLPLTIEYLETKGVPVIGLGTEAFPAFYYSDSGLGVDHCVADAQEAARIIKASLEFETGGGMLVTVPVPAAAELPREQCEEAIELALAEAEAKGIRGKDITPFMLARISELTEGKSRDANLALLINNASEAGRIAVQL